MIFRVAIFATLATFCYIQISDAHKVKRDNYESEFDFEEFVETVKKTMREVSYSMNTGKNWKESMQTLSVLDKQAFALVNQLAKENWYSYVISNSYIITLATYQ